MCEPCSGRGSSAEHVFREPVPDVIAVGNLLASYGKMQPAIKLEARVTLGAPKLAAHVVGILAAVLYFRVINSCMLVLTCRDLCLPFPAGCAA